MTVTRIEVTSAMTYPTQPYANVKASVTLSATVSDGEDAAQCHRELTALCDTLLLTHISKLAQEEVSYADLPSAS